MPTETTTKTKVTTRSITAARVVAAACLVLSMGVLGFTAGIAYYKAQDSSTSTQVLDTQTLYNASNDCAVYNNDDTCEEDQNCSLECECQEAEINENENTSEANDDISP